MKKNVLLSLLLIIILFCIGVPVNANLDNGLVGYYPFNGNANDESGNGNHGTVFNAVLTSDRFYKTDKAYSFDGNSYIKFPSLNFESQISISVWLNLEGENTIHPIITKYDGNSGDSDINISRSFQLLVHALHEDKFYFNASGDGVGSKEILSSTTAETNAWYHVACVFDSGETRLYVNGSLETKMTFDFTKLFQSNIPIIVGSFITDNPTVGGLYAKAKIDDIRLYNRVLSEIEIKYINEQFNQYIAGYEAGEQVCIDSMYSQEQLDQAISQKEIIISQLNSLISSMHTQEQLDQAVKEAKIGLYSDENVNLIINKLLEWDSDNDGTIGLNEAIQALKISTGIKPIE